MKFSFAYRTPFTKEEVIIEANNYKLAFYEFKQNVINKRFPISVNLDYVWLLDENDNYIERIK